MHTLPKINTEDGIWKSPGHGQAAAAQGAKAKLQIYRSLHNKPKRAKQATSVWRLRTGDSAVWKVGIKGFTESPFVYQQEGRIATQIEKPDNRPGM